ncbi:hypothetical protein [Planococcus sp. ISL-109]|uniref:hypothetical protein n=1 Tax=Planococcus sp. ISL-109 TaxID=2819166 RepID=UPI001BE9B769|nr:hypothetical protein [Planococcus sp. ISL-109]MBT2582906.1 hypothetical protein [Planococcus sp. ISL-109]
MSYWSNVIYLLVLMMRLGYLLFGLLYGLVPTGYVLTAYNMRPSIIREAYPELAEKPLQKVLS